MATKEELRAGAEFGFIDDGVEAQERYQPMLLTNQGGDTVLDHLYDELQTTQGFTFAVAFVTEGGLIDIKSTLNDLANRGIRGRLITSNYLDFNQPKVFKELLKLPNVDVRIINENGFHIKAYSFNHGDYTSVIIGSANLTQTALKKNFEWNLRVTSTDQGDITKQIQERLDDLWDQSVPLTEKWIADYSEHYQERKPEFRIDRSFVDNSAEITPNKMQEPALEALADLRQRGARKGLVVSATGTGKTYLAAFDVKQFNPDRMLFVVHREQILKKSIESFKKILGGSDSDYGLLSGTQKNYDAKYLFATVNMVSRPDIMEKLGSDRFDYILIDEAHRVGHNQDSDRETMYQRFMNYFKPEFMLGMTATPERTDGVNVYEYFDYNVAYEISLLDALDSELLAPFHYIGVTDFEKDGEIIDDTTELRRLVSDERVNYLLEKTNYYGYSGPKLHGLIFVSRIDEGEALVKALATRDIAARFISGKNSVEERERAVADLEDGTLAYIVTVDVFNEGVDIPKVNQIVMMRPTVSSIIFLQQLGRGLRKIDGKEYVTIIDFIGNYSNNYMIPMAFDKSRSSNKERIRKNIISPAVTGVSTINFEQVARQQILRAVGDAKLDSAARFKDAYNTLKQKIGNKIPMLVDFVRMGSVAIEDVVDKYKNLLAYQLKFETLDAVPNFDSQKVKLLSYLSKEIAVSKRILEIDILSWLIEFGQISDTEIKSRFDDAQYFYDAETLDSVERILNMSYFMKGTAEKYGDLPLIERTNGVWQLTDDFKKVLSDNTFKTYVSDAITAGRLNLLQNFDPSVRFQIGQKYLRTDVIKMLDWDKEQTGQNVGGYMKRPDDKFLPAFITLDKTDNYVNLVAYEDGFINRDTMVWFSKNQRTLKSPTEKLISESNEFGFIQMFVKKSGVVAADGKDFYYLGSAKVLSAEQETKRDAKDKETTLIKFEIRLEHPVNQSLYRALTE